MTRLEPPHGVMLDLLSSSCRRYTVAQSPVVLHSAFEAGRSAATIRVRQASKQLGKYRGKQGMKEFLEDILAQMRRDGYGEAQIEAFELKQSPWFVRIGIKVARQSCDNDLGVDARCCLCHKWFWRGLFNGLISEAAWISKERAGAGTKESALGDAASEEWRRKVWNARMKSQVLPRRDHLLFWVEL